MAQYLRHPLSRYSFEEDTHSIDALERGIHGYFPLRRPTRRRGRSPHPLPSQPRRRISPHTFLQAALQRISNPQHPLHFLVVPRRLPGGRLIYDWRKTTRRTARGRIQIGRYEGHEHGPVVQVGHQGAFAAGVPERLMLEDADLNQLSGRTIESRGAFSFKDAVIIGGIPVDVASAQLWERLGLLGRGTVARSPRRPAPTL